MPTGSHRPAAGKAVPASKRKPCTAGAKQALPVISLQDLQASIAKRLQSDVSTKMLDALDLTVQEILLLLRDHKMPASSLAYTAGVLTDKIGAILNGFTSIQVEYSAQADDIQARLGSIAERVASTGKASDTAYVEHTDAATQDADAAQDDE